MKQLTEAMQKVIEPQRNLHDLGCNGCHWRCCHRRGRVHLCRWKAASASKSATQSTVGEQQREYDQTRADQAPYRQIGVAALGDINNSMGGPRMLTAPSRVAARRIFRVFQSPDYQSISTRANKPLIAPQPRAAGCSQVPQSNLGSASLPALLAAVRRLL